ARRGSGGWTNPTTARVQWSKSAGEQEGAHDCTLTNRSGTEHRPDTRHVGVAGHRASTAPLTDVTGVPLSRCHTCHRPEPRAKSAPREHPSAPLLPCTLAPFITMRDTDSTVRAYRRRGSTGNQRGSRPRAREFSLPASLARLPMADLQKQPSRESREARESTPWKAPERGFSRRRAD